MNYCDQHLLLTREHMERRMREANAERLAREIRGAAQRDPRRRWHVKFGFGASHQRVQQSRAS